MGKKVGIAGLLFILITSTQAQDSTLIRDLETWSSATIAKKLFDKRIEVSLSEQMRLDNNSTRMSEYFTDFGVDAKVYKNFSVGFDYRFIKARSRQELIGNTTDKLKPEQRFSVDVSYKNKFDRLQLSYRVRYQNRNFIGYKPADGDVSVIKYRLKVTAEYNIKKWKLDPYLAGEIFYTKDQYSMNYIPEITETYDISAWQKYRFTLGTSYKFNKHFKISGFYRLEHQFGNYPFGYNPKNWNIFGINLKYTI